MISTSSATQTDCNGHYSEVLPGKLYVGDKHAAENPLMLQLMGVTHIVSCGFERPLQPARKYISLCINVMDIPHANLLQHLPRAVKFIESVIMNSDKHKGAVYVHCVHGQSRSCSVCVAFLMRQLLRGRKTEAPFSGGGDLLWSCYERVKKCRSSMAINPGFVRQLDIFRRMGCGLAFIPDAIKSEKPPLSSAYASFRSFRAKTQFHEHSTVLLKFQDTYESRATDDKSALMSNCKKCRTRLFCSFHVLDEWTETSMLPSSDYWAESFGGKEYKCQQGNFNINKVDFANCIEVEPMDWMRSQMVELETGLLMEKGRLNCPSCSVKIGFFDWKFPQGMFDPNSSEHLISAIFIQNTKVVNM